MLLELRYSRRHHPGQAVARPVPQVGQEVPITARPEGVACSRSKSAMRRT